MFNKFKKQITLIFSLTLIAICIGGLNKSIEVTASAGQNVSGWAWGESEMPDGTAGGAGWISFNCTSAPYGCGIDYGVNIDLATGIMTGSAWSENYGWIKFDAGCPAGASGVCGAKLDLATNKLMGWAKVLSGDDVDDGFDGWISLNSLNDHNFVTGLVQTSPFVYGITFAPFTGVLSGYAWGSDVTGWIQFTDVNVDIDALGGDLNFVPTVSVLGSITGLPNTITVPGGSVVLNWNSTSGTVYDHCTPTSMPVNASWNSTIINATASNLPPLAPAFKYKAGITLPVLPGSNVFTLQCFPVDGGAPVTREAVVMVVPGALPPLNLYIAGTTNTTGSVYSPYKIDLSWKSDAPNFNTAIACHGTRTNAGGVVLSEWDLDAEAVPTVPGTYYTEYGMDVPTDPTYFKITCTSLTGFPVDSNLVTINRLLVDEGDGPTVSFSGSCTQSTSGLDPYVSWSSSDAISCDATAGANFETGGDTSGVDSVATLVPSVDPYSYSIQCENDGGDDTKTANVYYLPVGESCSPIGCDPAVDPLCIPCVVGVDPWCAEGNSNVRPVFNEQRHEDVNP